MSSPPPSGVLLTSSANLHPPCMYPAQYLVLLVIISGTALSACKGCNMNREMRLILFLHLSDVS